MALKFAMNFCAGLVFGNIGALTLQSLGRMAGLGASVTASVFSLIALLVAAFCGWFYDATLPPLALGLFIAGLLVLLFLHKSRRAPLVEIDPVELSDVAQRA
jgi:DHA1 family bicyclomycin/chloramphenicol resistance-like MFS transporter